MSKNDILRFFGITLILSLSIFLIVSSVYLIDRILHPTIRVKLTGDYIQDEIVSALITANVVEDLEDIKKATN
jgi:hypothetical protein